MGDYILDVPSIAMCSYSKGSEESGLYVSVLSSHARYILESFLSKEKSH